ncbi:2'-5' RNA ligase family protein [Halobacterium zhouii]|uniref:2'-5' RNA ligase family protein n=1 Tax=Halobacterium zhouii TaxID=2902624 RepID=UPI001E4F5C45|nr:2'-5' RNA ligase family protein [Halobacterium zhouii]
MYSVNVPVPPAVHDVADDLRPALTGFDRVRERGQRTLLVKRVPAENRRELRDDWRTAKRALEGAPAFEARIAGIDTFDDPPAGTSSPVAYLAVESPGIHDVHARLCSVFDPVEQLEGGDDYDPHVTLGRGADGLRGRRAIADLLERDVDPVTWTVTELELYDANHYEPVDAISLPA